MTGESPTNLASQLSGSSDDIFSTSVDESFSAARRTVISIVDHAAFDATMGLIICFNLLLVIVETDYSAGCTGSLSLKVCSSGYGETIRRTNLVLLALYCLELSLRLFARRCGYFSTIWNTVDGLIVVLTIVSEIIGNAMGSFSQLRLLRLIRVLRGARVLSFFRELRMIVAGLLSTFKAIIWAALLMCVVLTMWSILAVEFLHPFNVRLVEQYKNCPRCGRALASVMDANLTFFQALVIGDDWDFVLIPMIENYPWTLAVFLGVFFTIALGIMNLILAVIVDSAAEARDLDVKLAVSQKERAKMLAKGRLMDLCKSLDVDNSGTLSHQEMQDAFVYSPEFKAILSLLDVDREDLECVFRLMDSDDSGDVSYSEFAELLYRMKSQNSRTLLMFIKYYVMDLRRGMMEELRLVKGDMVNKVKRNSQILEVIVKDLASRDLNDRLDSDGSTTDNVPSTVSSERQSMHNIALQAGPNLILGSQSSLCLEKQPTWHDARGNSLNNKPSKQNGPYDAAVSVMPEPPRPPSGVEGRTSAFTMDCIGLKQQLEEELSSSVGMRQFAAGQKRPETAPDAQYSKLNTFDLLASLDDLLPGLVESEPAPCLTRIPNHWDMRSKTSNLPASWREKGPNSPLVAHALRPHTVSGATGCAKNIPDKPIQVPSAYESVGHELDLFARHIEAQIKRLRKSLERKVEEEQERFMFALQPLEAFVV